MVDVASVCWLLFRPTGWLSGDTITLRAFLHLIGLRLSIALISQKAKKTKQNKKTKNSRREITEAVSGGADDYCVFLKLRESSDI